MESRVGNSFLSLSKLWVPLSQCHKMSTCQTIFFVSDYFTDLYENLADSFATEIRSQTDGCSLHIRHFYFIKYA